MEVTVEIEKSNKSRWTILESKKTAIMSYCETYADWTLPYVFPRNGITQSTQLPIALDSIGAQGVNHLSNKIISTLYPAKSLFFRLHIDQEMKDLVELGMMAANQGADKETLKQQVASAVLDAEQAMSKAEKRAEEHLDMVQYRPQAINAAKFLIITGNALVFHPEDGGKVQVYGLRDYCIVRDCSGGVVEIMTRETKAFSTFKPSVQDALKADRSWRAKHNSGSQHKDYKDDDEVTIYTRVLLEDDGKYHVTQYADDVRLNFEKAYTRTELRWIPLVWNLIQGEDYGRGLVADFAGAFHGVNVMSGALLNIAAVMGDIKFLVHPQSSIDIVTLQNGLPGSYHYGKAEEVGTAKIDRVAEAQFLQAMIERYERQISMAMMLMQQITRNAERVTATEINRDVEDLEISNGGVYSRLAADWQVPTANLALQDTGFKAVGNGIQPRVLTGMDSLSRAGEAYNMQLFLTMLGMLNTVPEEFRAAIKRPEFLKQVSEYYQVPYESWVATSAELAAAAAAQQQQQQALIEQENQGKVEQETAKQVGQASE